VSEDAVLRSKSISIRVLDPLSRLLIFFALILCISRVHPGEEPSIKAHVSEESGVGIGMSKRIDLPSNPWFDSKFFQDEVMADFVVVDHVLVGRTSFVVHRPSTIDHLKLLVLD